MKEPAKTKEFIATNKKKVEVSFDCECGAKVTVTVDIPKPNLEGDNYSNGMGITDVGINCPVCGKEYNVKVQIDPTGTQGVVYIDPPINEASLSIKPLP